MKATNSFTDSCLIGKEKKKSMVEILSRQGQSLLNDDDIEAEFIDFYKGSYTKRDGNHTLSIIDNWNPWTIEQAQAL